jgi:hypothetical protein
VRWASLDLTRRTDGLALPRLPHIAMFPPPAAAPPCPAGPPPVAAGPPAAAAPPAAPPAGPAWTPDPRRASSWRYVLKFDLPSRIATMKNALGDTVSVIPSYTPPSFDLATRAGLQGPWSVVANSVTIHSIKDSNKWVNAKNAGDVQTVTEINPDCTPGLGIVPGCTTWEFVISSSAAMDDPGPPFDALDSTSEGRPKAGVGTWAEEGPAKIISSSRAEINWGLIAYSNVATDTCLNYDTTLSNKLVTAINPMGTDITPILSSMSLARDSGIEVGGGTPTRAGLEKAQQQLLDTFANDPLYLCLRNYGVILVTDGESNKCNNGSDPGKAWGAPGNTACHDDWASSRGRYRSTRGPGSSASARRSGTAS